MDIMTGDTPRARLERLEKLGRAADQGELVAAYREALAAGHERVSPSGIPVIAKRFLLYLSMLEGQGEARALITEIVAQGAQGFWWIDTILKGRRGEMLPLQLHFWAEAHRLHGESAEVRSSLLRCALGSANRPAAAPLAEALAIELAAEPPLPSRYNAWCLLGDYHLLADELESAMAAYDTARGLSPTPGRACLGLAATRLEQGDLPRARALAAEAASAFTASGDTEAARLASLARHWRMEAAPLRRLALIVFTHVSTKLRRNAEMGAPGIGLIETTITSCLRQLAPGPEVALTVFLDQWETPLNEEYRHNLAAWCASQGHALVVNQGNGLRRQWLDAFSRLDAETDAVLVLEHDHRFLPKCPRLDELLAIMAARPDLNYLRLNRRKNTVMGFDWALDATRRDLEQGVLRTARFSNTPHILRRRFFDEMVLPLIAGRDRRDKINGGAGGVEENINTTLAELEGVTGTVPMMRFLGLGIWGRRGRDQVLSNIGI